MHNRFLLAIQNQKDKTQQYTPFIAGTLGIAINGVLTVEVPTRPSYVYVQLRSSQAEVIQAFNDQVSPAYGLPVLVEWQSNRYVIIGRDTSRYSNWQTSSSYLPRHAATHEFGAVGGGGDVVFVWQQQLMPVLPMPSGSVGSNSIVVNDYIFMNNSGQFNYSPVQSTVSFLPWNPTASADAQMVLVSLDMQTNSLRYDVGSGSTFSAALTGSSDVATHIPAVPDITRYLPIAAIRLVTGSLIIGWDSIYDVRQIFGIGLAGPPGATGTGGGGGGGGGVDQIGFYGLNNGMPLGSGTWLNLRGQNYAFTLSGTTFDLFLTGTAGGGGTDQIGFYAENAGSPLGTGTILNVRGQNYTFTLSGTTADLFLTGSPFPRDNIGIYGENAGVPLGTGTILNARGQGVTLSISGTTLDLFITGTAGSQGPTGPAGAFGVYGEAAGVPLGTGSIFNVRGSNATFTISGTTLDLFVTGASSSCNATYSLAGIPIAIATPTGTDWKVPSSSYASGSLAVFYNGSILVKGTQYEELIYISGTYHLLFTPVTGATHMVTYGVSCTTQTYSTGSNPPPGVGITDSNGTLIVDSNGTQIVDSNGN